jgi:hypothetical protein
LKKLIRADQAYMDIANVEGLGGVAQLLSTVPADRVFRGSNFLFFYYESAVMKMRESKLEPAQGRAIQ